MSSRMIGNKSVEEAFQILEGKYEGTYSTKNNKKYIPVGMYYQRMKEAFGNVNVRVDYSMPSLQEMERFQHSMYMAKCTISVYDNAGVLVTSRDGVGATEILPLKDNATKTSWPTNAPASAARSAYKDACKQLGIFSLIYCEDEDGKINSNQSSQRGNSNSNNSNNNGYKVYYTTSKFRTLGSEPNYVYKCSASLQNGNTMEECELVIYGDKVVPELQKLMTSCNNTGKQVAIKAYATVAKNTNESLPQHILKKFYP